MTFDLSSITWENVHAFSADMLVIFVMSTVTYAGFFIIAKVDTYYRTRKYHFELANQYYHQHFNALQALLKDDLAPEVLVRVALSVSEVAASRQAAVRLAQQLRLVNRANYSQASSQMEMRAAITQAVVTLEEHRPDLVAAYYEANTYAFLAMAQRWPRLAVDIAPIHLSTRVSPGGGASVIASIGCNQVYGSSQLIPA